MVPAEDHRLDDGRVGRGAARSLDDEALGDEVEARAAHLLGKADAEEPGSGQLRPQLAVEGTLAAGIGLDLPQPLVGRTLVKDPVGELADGLLFLAVREVHGELLLSIEE